MEETELMEQYWRPKLNSLLAYKKELLKLKLIAISKKEAKRVRRCKRNLQNVRLGGYIYEPQGI